ASTRAGSTRNAMSVDLLPGCIRQGLVQNAEELIDRGRAIQVRLSEGDPPQRQTDMLTTRSGLQRDERALAAWCGNDMVDDCVTARLLAEIEPGGRLHLVALGRRQASVGHLGRKRSEAPHRFTGIDQNRDRL